jgi:hypothetical protein
MQFETGQEVYLMNLRSVRQKVAFGTIIGIIGSTSSISLKFQRTDSKWTFMRHIAQMQP